MPKPNYQRIDQLERELGIGPPEPERGIRVDQAVCLSKGCDGESTEIYTWAGVLLRTWHTHQH